jgi:GNAT superfamily N-acetyltransferase
MGSILRGGPRLHAGFRIDVQETPRHNTIVITIRRAQPGDVPLILSMLQASAEDQGFPAALVVTDADLLEDGFGPQPRFQCSVAEVDGRPAGMALYYFNYSTWVSRNGLYIEDLYVSPGFRHAGVARNLLEHLRGIARREGCHRMQWVVHRDNADAIRLYRKFGAKSLDDWILMSKQEGQ